MGFTAVTAREWHVRAREREMVLVRRAITGKSRGTEGNLVLVVLWRSAESRRTDNNDNYHWEQEPNRSKLISLHRGGHMSSSE